MIYIYSNTVTIYIPRTNTALGSNVVFENQLTHNTITISIPSEAVMNETFYSVGISAAQIANFENGQYDYAITNEDGIVLECGIAQYGDFNVLVTDYDTNLTIKQYNG